MNFLDTFDVTASEGKDIVPNLNKTPVEGSSSASSTAEGSTTDAAPAEPPMSPSFEQEVTQVAAQLSGWWGGFVKQGQSALDSARKDIGERVMLAQKEFNKVVTSDVKPDPEVATPTQASVSEKGKEKEILPAVDAEEQPSEATPSSSSPPPTTFFSRFQASLPPSVVSSVTQLQNNIRPSLDFDSLTQLRDTVSAELQKVQDQAGQYVQRSETILRDTLRDVTEALEEAVKVIPPENYTPSSVWDGTDVWMLSTTNSLASSRKGKGKGSDATAGSVATRAQALLKQLKFDPEVIKRDPDADASDEFKEWISQNGNPSDEQIAKELVASTDGEALKKTLDTLVPSELTSEQFWTRYFFRVHQVEQDESKRQALLQRIDHDEEFSWEDDEETSANPQNPALLSTSQSTLLPKPPKSAVSSGAGTPARVSSEDSYDVVSNVGDGKSPRVTTEPKLEKTKSEEDEGDSDWE